MEPIETVGGTRALSIPEAAEGRPVRLSGVISYLRFTAKDFNFNLHDASGGVMVYPENRVALEPGQFVTVTGMTAGSVHGLRIAKATVVPGEMRALPVPVPITTAEVLEGKAVGDFAELEATVRVVRLESPEISPRRLALDFGARRQRLTAWVTQYEAGSVALAPGATVRVRGVVLQWTNPRGQVQSTSLLVNAMSDVHPVREAPEALAVAVRDLLLWNGTPGKAARVRTQGVLTLNQPGELSVLQEGDRAIRVRMADSGAQSATHENFSVGQRVEVIGFPVLGDYTVELEDAQMHPLKEPASTRKEWQVERFDDAAGVLAGAGWVDRDGRLISVPGTVRAVLERDGRRALEIAHGQVTFTAWLPLETPLPEALRAGSQVRVEGVCNLLLSDTQRRIGHGPKQFSLTLADVRGVSILRPAPWWTAAHLFAALGVVAAAALLMGLWIGVLGKKNRRLREEIRARELAERTLGEERRRVAGELHDTLEQTLVATALQLNAASRTLATAPEAAAPCVLLAGQLVARSRQEVRDAVWDLRLQRPEALATLLERLCAESSAKACAEVNFSLEGNPPQMPALVTAHCTRLVREALANALKHAAPNSIRVTLRTTEALLQISVSDDGRGFDPLTAPGPDHGHFGLTGMEERVQRLGGTLRLVSAPGRGTTLHFELGLPG